MKPNRPDPRPNTVPTPPRDLRDTDSWSHWVEELFAAAPQRARHSRAVWHRVAAARRHELRWLPADQFDTLELAALLHDIGRGLDPDDLAPHGFVGARHLDELGLTEVAPLVAHHSAARLEAAHRGMSHLDVWESDPMLVAILTYVDRTTSPHGHTVTMQLRRAELVTRFGEEAPQVAWFDGSAADARRGEQLFRHSPPLTTA